jgi:hypothetical protein
MRISRFWFRFGLLLAIGIANTAGIIFAASSASGLAGVFCDTTLSGLRNHVAAKSLNEPPNHRSSGTRKVLVLRPTFSDDTTDPFPPARAELLDEVAGFYATNSYHKLDLKFTVSPLLPLAKKQSDYVNQNYDLQVDASRTALEQGLDPDEYDFCAIFSRSYLPDHGVAEIGGKFSVCGDQTDAGVLAHELGHNLGLYHANSWRGKNESVIGEGESREYGNGYNVMGGKIEGLETCHFGTWEKHELGWLPDSAIPLITNSATVTLYPFDHDFIETGKDYAIRVPKDERDYWIEYRPTIRNHVHSKDGLFILWSPSRLLGPGTLLLDMHPTFQIWNDPLLIGQSFTDKEAGITFTVLARSGEGLELSIAFETKTSHNLPPAVEISTDKTSAAVDEPITFQANASDPDGNEISYFWTFSDGAVAWGPTALKAFPYRSYGIACCAVSDRKGQVTYRNVQVKIGNGFGVTISGRVTTSSGTVVQGAHIEASYFEAWTDNEGVFLLSVPWPEVDLNAFYEGVSFSPAGFSNPLNTSESKTGIDFTIPEFAAKLGTIRRQDGAIFVVWPDPCDGCVLQIARDTASGWQAVGVDPLAGHIYQIENISGASPNGYFRLMRPF